jgi:hypothetical protein
MLYSNLLYNSTLITLINGVLKYTLVILNGFKLVIQLISVI